MSERYWLSGVQIGLIKVQIQSGKYVGALRTLEEVENNQFIGRVENNKQKIIIKDKVKPEPLDLEETRNWLLKSLIEEEREEKEPLSIEYILMRYELEIKQRIKSACEFYLRYKDRPDLLLSEHPEYKKEVKGLNEIKDATLIDLFRIAKEEDNMNLGMSILGLLNDYNDWLFKLAFKDILEVEE